MKCVRASSEAEREDLTQELVAAIKKEIEPLLEAQGKGPFFGGSERLTLAEVRISFSFFAGICLHGIVDILLYCTAQLEYEELY
jgi:hypothetical protein